MSPEGLSCLSREHYLANLRLHLSHTFSAHSPIQSSRGISHHAQGKKNSYSGGWGRTWKDNVAGVSGSI
jgi:hypothetical protein